MPKSYEIQNKKKTRKILHYEPGDYHLDYVLAPVGYSYNIELASAKKGDVLEFSDGIRHRIISVRRIKTSGSLADILSVMRYGISIRACRSRWRTNARLAGNSPDVVSDAECLWIIYEKRREEEG